MSYTISLKDEHPRLFKSALLGQLKAAQESVKFEFTKIGTRQILGTIRSS